MWLQYRRARFGARSAGRARCQQHLLFCPDLGLYPAGKSSLLRSVSVLGPISRRAKADTLAVISGTRQQCNLQVHTAAAIVGKQRPLIAGPRRCGNERKSRGGEAPLRKRKKRRNLRRRPSRRTYARRVPSLAFLNDLFPATSPSRGAP